jgi:hypothetical protein
VLLQLLNLQHGSHQPATNQTRKQSHLTVWPHQAPHTARMQIPIMLVQHCTDSPSLSKAAAAVIWVEWRPGPQAWTTWTAMRTQTRSQDEVGRHTPPGMQDVPSTLPRKMRGFDGAAGSRVEGHPRPWNPSTGQQRAHECCRQLMHVTCATLSL